MTGYSREQLEVKLSNGVSYREFFADAPRMNPDCTRIKGVVCGIHVETIEDP